MVHLHIPGDFEGEIHLHVEPPGVHTTPLTGDDNGVVEASDVEKILKRFENHDPATAARAVYTALVERGWEANVPTSKTGNVSNAAYLRLVYKGTHRTVSVFLNTVSLVYARKDASELVKHVGDAELHADGSMYLYHAEGKAERALGDMTSLEDWANGQAGHAG